MTLQVCESFDGIEVGRDLQFLGPKWDTNLSSNQLGVIVADGRNGQGLKATSSVKVNLQRSMSGAVGVMGFAFKMTGSVPTSNTQLCQFNTSGAGTATLIIRANTGELYIRVSGSSVESDSGFFLSVDTWYYIEWKLRVGNSPNTRYDLFLHVDGIEVFTVQRTSAASSNVIRAFIGSNSSPGSGNTWIFDDIYVLNGAGTVNNDFLGDSVVQVIRPNGDGATSQWTNSGGDSVNNFSFVDEQTVDDTDYVAAGTNDFKDLYTYSNISLTTGYGVRAVQQLVRAASTDGQFNLALVARESDGTESDSGTFTLSTSFANTNPQPQHFRIMEADPSGDNWSSVTVNGAQFGQKAKSP